MACACKVAKDIDYIYKKYGTNNDKVKAIGIKRKKTRSTLAVKNIFEGIAAYSVVLLLLPFIILYVVYNLSKKEKEVSIFKFLRLIGLSKKRNGK